MTYPVIYFNEELHKYTDNLSNTYTSTTTLIGKYIEAFDTKAVAAATSRKYWNAKGHKYYRMTAAEIEAAWVVINTEACTKGTIKHNYLEVVVKTATNYKRNAGSMFINDRIYTIVDIMNDHNFGLLDIDDELFVGLRDKYPLIYKTLMYYNTQGFHIYAEIGVFDLENRLVSGLIDLLLLNHTTKEFKIVDWKTNKHKLQFEAGYFKRDVYGNDTTEWIAQPHKRLKYPLDGVQDSHGSIYTLQLSTYAHMVEQFGYENVGIILFHIRELSHVAEVSDEVVEYYKIDFWKYEVEAMIQHHWDKRQNELNRQLTLL